MIESLATNDPRHGVEETMYRSTAGISDSAALLELSSILNASLDLGFILSNVLLTAMGKLLIGKGVVLIANGKWRYQIRSLKGISRNQFQDEFMLPVEWKTIQQVEDLNRTSDKSVRLFAQCCAECGIQILVPMSLKDQMVGVVGLGKKITGQPFSDNDYTFLESVTAVAASAVNSAMTIDKLRDVNRRLDSKVQELNTLFELSREMNTTFDEQLILRTLSYALMGQLRVMRFAVFTFDGRTLHPVLVKLPGFKPHNRHHKMLMKFDEAKVFDDENIPGNAAERWLHGLGIRTIVPMRTQHQTRGVLCLGERVGAVGFDETEQEFVAALANITISALENARLVKETIEKEQLEKELSLARTIQKGLLPSKLPTPPGYEIAAINESSLQVGGDYYDVIPLSPHRFAFAIGDVSGKGIPASLLMANVQAAWRTIVPLELPLEEATMRINTLVYSNTSADKFITFFWGILDTEHHTVTYINAGHNPPYFVAANGSITALTEGGMILGVLSTVPPYRCKTIALQAGDMIVSYTDGVNEALSKNMEEFGDDRLQNTCRKLASESAEAVVEKIKKDILAFTRGAKQSDDITMLVLRRVH